jgi:hypothetical protein
MTLYIVFFVSSLLPVTISYKYFTFSHFAIFNLAFSFPFKLREELFYFNKPWLSILEVKFKHYSILIYSFENFNTNIIVTEKS